MERPPRQEALPLGRCGGRDAARGKVRALGGTPTCSGLFAKPTRGGQWGRCCLQRRGAPPLPPPTLRSALAHLPRPTSSTLLSPSRRKGANVGIACGRKARTLGIFPSRGNLCHPRLTSRPPSQPPSRTRSVHPGSKEGGGARDETARECRLLREVPTGGGSF